MARVLVTGGAGFVGRHICMHLLSLNFEVVCVDPIVSGTGGLEPKDWKFGCPLEFESFEWLNMDCRDYFTSSFEQFDYVFHLAAIVGGRLVIENDPLAVATDLTIDSSFWNWAKLANPNKIVYFSSSAAYPLRYQTESNYELLTEDMISFDDSIGVPDLTYGWSKLTGEYLARLAYERHGLRSIVYRPFSGYGPDQDETYPVPAICKRVLGHKGSSPLIVWGRGTQLRDFIHIDDCIKGIFVTMDKINNGDALNLSTSEYTSFLELAQVTSKLAARNLEVTSDVSKPEGVFARAGDTTKQLALGFVPDVSLEEGLRDCLNFLLP